MDPGGVAKRRGARPPRWLRERCRGILRDLELPRPFDVFEMFRRYAVHSGRRIELHEAELGADGPFACWLRSPNTGADHVFYAGAATPEHRTLLLGHEFGHMIAEHEAGGHLTTLPPGMAAGLASPATEYPDLDPEMVRRWLWLRSMYDTPQERDAELIATQVLTWARQVDDAEVAQSGDAALDAIVRTVSPPQGWL